MVSYRFNLLGRFDPKEYKKIADKALSTARAASAVDTGKFKSGWRVDLIGDFLIVSNSTRYAAPVELGSIVHKTHKHKVKNALAKIGLRDTSSGPKQEQEEVISLPELSIGELRSPALLRNRFKPPQIKIPSYRNLMIPKAQLFNRTFLLGALAAIEATSEKETQEK